MGVIDPEEAAYFEIRELFDLYKQRTKGTKPSKGLGYAGSPGLRNMRNAIDRDDSKAFAEAKRSYLRDEHRTQKSFDASVGRGEFPDTPEFEHFSTSFLTPDQKKKLTMAKRHAKNRVATMLAWWDWY